MLEHVVFSAALKKQRLHGNGRQVRYNLDKLHWDTLGICDIHHNEAGHTG